MNGQIEFVISTWRVVRVHLKRLRNACLIGVRNICVSGNERDRVERGHCWRIYRTAVYANAKCGARIGLGPGGADTRPVGAQASQCLLESHTLESVNDLLHAIQAIVKLRVSAADDRLVLAENPAQESVSKMRIPCRSNAWSKIRPDRVPGILAMQASDGRKPISGL